MSEIGPLSGSGNVDAEAEGAHHTGAWKVAYADLTTALMAFFIVLWILGQSADVKEGVQKYFRDPTGSSEGGKDGLLEGAAQLNPLGVLQDEDAAAAESVLTAEEDELWRSRAKKLRESLDGLPSFERYKDQIELALTPEGLRISLIEIQESALFQVGRVGLKPEAEELLEAIGREIQTLDRPAIIEGHTDGRQFVGKGRMTNWELSTGRAHTARRVLERIGIPSKSIVEVRGFADRQLYNSADANDGRNRRISITLLSEAAVELRRRTRRAEVLD